jgi:hypothetical protein
LHQDEWPFLVGAYYDWLSLKRGSLTNQRAVVLENIDAEEQQQTGS